MTPNPRVMKFVANQLLIPSGLSLEFQSAEEAGASHLAQMLFTFPMVEGVFLTENFVSVTITENLDWNDVVTEVREYILGYIQAGNSVVDESLLKANTKEDAVSELGSDEVAENDFPVSEYDEKIKHILNEYVTPAVASDGGAVEFVSFEDGTLNLKLKGACNGCPSSRATLQNGIKGLFDQLLPAVKEIQAV